MAISLATTLTPFMGRGQPRVVITGRFALGFVRSVGNTAGNYRVGHWLNLAGLATAVSGRVFSVKVTGRPLLPEAQSYVWNGQLIPDYEATGLTRISRPAFANNPEPDYADYEGSVVMANSFIMPDPDQTDVAHRSTTYKSWLYWAGDQQWASGVVAMAHPIYPELTKVIPGAPRIELFGALSSLDLRVLVAMSYYAGGQLAVPTLQNVSTVDPYESYMERYANYYLTTPSCLVDGTWTGWRTDSVHIIDQPWLRGHVLGANLAEQGVVWD